MKTNVRPDRFNERTHEGATAARITPEKALRRSVLSCLLWEKEFYEDGETITDRIDNMIPKVKPEVVAALAIEAREKQHLRHIPLYLLRELARYGKMKAADLTRVIQRADELGEFLSLYWKDGKVPISRQVRRGLADAFYKFNEYQFSKWNRDAKVKLRDVMFLTHPKPADEAQTALFKKIADNALDIPDTWEVALSANDGKTKKEKWERLVLEKRLGGLATLRNLRNMIEAGLPHDMIGRAILQADYRRVLPFRFIAAAKYAVNFERELENAMLASLSESENALGGLTDIIVDVSGSMQAILSGKSELSRMDAACGVAMVAREICDRVRVFTFSTRVVQVPARSGFALRDAIVNSQPHGNTLMSAAIRSIKESKEEATDKADRCIIISDEQSADGIPDPYAPLSYMINVASNKNGIGYGGWTHIDGWSDAVIRFICEIEKINE